MRTFTLTAVALLALTVNLSAAKWRVNNIPGTNANFTSLQAAHNASYVNNGDTIYLEASSGSYGDLTATKKLVIIGAGYFLSENENMQANLNSSTVGYIRFNAESDGSIISGCTIGRVLVNASNILIERNRIIAPAGYRGIDFYGTQNNVVIRQNHITGGGYSTNTSPHAISCTSTANNVTITNNYITRIYGSAIVTGSSFSGIIKNNIISGNTTIYNTEFYNNIMIEGTFNQNNSSFNNNIGNSTQFGTANGNQQNVDMSNVFVGTGSTDGKWQLKGGSPAIGAGVGGVDCGMFGGDFPYQLSGLPGVPAIYFHEQTIDNVNQKLNVTIKAKSHN
ncbi:MAG TPA: right-handed parallel beta-helix repeat-containing protein [Salinivirgaceae bacterium]|mgnify:CR=1 FL=1|nr:right-handed parallel beta-helix repeat-containing protein [Salinivirgaceae bacterium]